MLTFGITTTTKCSSISLHEGNKLLGEITVEVMKSHSITILQKIEKLFEWCEKEIKDVKNVIVSIGPGSFTGVRIAIAVVKGIFYDKNVNIYSVNELDALAYKCSSLEKNNLKNGDIIYSVIDSGKEKIYYSKYMVMNENKNRILLFEQFPVVSKLDKLIKDIEGEKNNGVYLVGDGIFNYLNKLEENFKNNNNIKILQSYNLKINASFFYRMMMENLLEKTDLFVLKPDYLEKSQAERDRENKKNI